MENLKEIDRFLDTNELPTLNQEDIKTLNISTTNNEIETVMKNLPTKKNPGHNGFTAKFNKNFSEDLMLTRSFSEIKREGVSPNWFLDAVFILS